MRKSIAALTLATLSLVAAAGAGRPAGPDHEGARSKDILFRAAATGKARTFATALILAELVDTIRGDGPFTVFVPTDEAFARLPSGTLEGLLRPENKAKLAAVLAYHVLPGRVTSNEITNEPRPKTLNGARLTIAANARGIAVDDATVVQADLVCKNGVIHLIDRVLTPGKPNIVGVAEKAGFGVLVAALKAAKLDDDLKGDGPFTVFAPTDEAFAKLGRQKLRELLAPGNRHELEAILKYHVVKGRVTAKEAIAAGQAKTLQGGKVEARIADGRLLINNARAVATDVEADNGIIHAIDTVLIPR